MNKDKQLQFKNKLEQQILSKLPGEFKIKPMFGGYGIYCDGIFFAIIADSELYLKGAKTDNSVFINEGSREFIYSQGNHKPVGMNYWLVPEKILTDITKLKEWVDKAIASSVKAKRRK